MKSANKVTPIFNNKVAERTLISFCFRGRKWEMNVQSLKKLQEKPVVFVFAQIDNIWAKDFIFKFNTALFEWVPGGSFPPPIFIITTECRGDLQEKLMFNPQISSGDVSHIVSIGDMASAEVARFRLVHDRLDIPQLFCVTGDPAVLELTDLDGNLITNTNGVFATEVDSFTKPLRVLRHVSDKVRSIAIVYGRKSRFDLIADQKAILVQRIIEACLQQGIKATTLLIDEESNYDVDCAHLIGRVDAFLTLQDTTVYTQNQAIAAFCNKHKIIFIASELSSVVRGASLGFGNSPAAYIAPLIELMAIQRATHTPLHKLEAAGIKESVEMRYNLVNMKQQVADLSDEKVDLLEMLSIHLSY